MKKIALDVDGVLLNFMPSFDKAAEIVLDRRIEIERDHYQMSLYHLGQRVKTDNEKVGQILEYMIDSKMYEKLEPLPGAKESLERIARAGYKIYNVTALPEKAKEMRLKNLKDVLDFEPEEIFCVGMGLSKEQALFNLRPDVFIDDRIHYLGQAPFVYHLGWIDQRETQDDLVSGVDAHSYSLLEWTDKHLPRVTKKLDRFYKDATALQLTLKLVSAEEVYPPVPQRSSIPKMRGM